MKRFQFRLARVLSLRHRQVELSEARLHAHERSTQEARDDAIRLRNDALEGAKPPARGSHVPAANLAAASAYGDSLQRKADRREQVAQHMAAQKKTMLADHLHLRRNLATLETLYARDFRKHQREQELAAEAQAMETHVAKRQRELLRRRIATRAADR